MYDAEIHHRRSRRWRRHDYSDPGWYFITGCEQQKRCIFGGVVGGAVRLSPLGDIVAACWKWLPKKYPYVTLDEWTVMPNHIHGIIVLSDVGAVGKPSFFAAKPGTAAAAMPKRKSLGRLVGAFKTVSTNQINAVRGTEGPSVWQRDFHDRVIRDQAELEKIRDYIRTNPLRWRTT